jgi:hypothetical protein
VQLLGATLSVPSSSGYLVGLLHSLQRLQQPTLPTPHPLLAASSSSQPMVIQAWASGRRREAGRVPFCQYLASSPVCVRSKEQPNPPAALPSSPPSVFGRNLQCELVRKVDTREECHWSHACSLEASRRGTNGILECKFLSKKRTLPSRLQARGLVPP